MTNPALDQLHRQAIQFYQQGQFTKAMECAQSVFKVQKRDPHIMNTIGLIYAAMGDHKKAIASYKKAVKIQGRDPMMWQNYAASLSASGNLSQAKSAYQSALKLDGNNYATLNNLAHLLLQLKQYGQIEEYLNKAITLDANRPEAHNNLGLYLEDMNDLEGAANAYREAINRQSNHPLFWHHLAQVQAKQDLHDDAVASCKKAIELAPNFDMAHKKLGRLYIEAGQLKEAEESLRKALSIAPNCDAFFQLAGLDCVALDDPIFVQMRAHYETADLSNIDRELLGFALARILDKNAFYDVAFDYLLKANKIRRQSFKYNVKQSEGYFDAVTQLYDADYLAAHVCESDNSLQPIFVLGMPRSGTTLVEQILASHPGVSGAGEVTYLKEAIQAHYPDYFKGKPVSEMAKIAQVGADYLSQLSYHAAGKKIVTDKFTNNFEFIGLIKQALPNAKTIHVMRDAKDTCLSCFMQSFGSDMPFIYDLAELGRYYKAYEKLMAHWSELLGDEIYHISYEQLIEDRDGEVAKLLDFCDLEFAEECHQFHEQKRRVKTASYVQVRQPIYRKSMQRWKNYETHLDALSF
ncbi:sulfotransferase [Terasakiella sp. A23]|uniref:tetratricopeptide repeat-containing sulfotransferase family protein n=1 Tax=Terasakiella sp. FCG-A23 TaxID=3080561 RepID=UPI002952ACE2|nr:sulfotransferase [Terasakiella sp. A23]MDV7340870.1 sulfotransferase [Terasakiella sp. A23]